MEKIISLADQRNFGFLEAVIAMMLTIMVIETINVTASTCMPKCTYILNFKNLVYCQAKRDLNYKTLETLQNATECIILT